jgi:hypothetical protein
MFDPTKPANHSPNSAAEMRAQLAGLKALIDAVPAGPPGPQGPEGPVISTIQIGSVTTGSPGTPASASVNVFGNNVELSFTIPQGETGSGVTSTDVTNAIANEITGTARNPNTVGMLSTSVSAQPTQSELMEVIAKINELIGSLQR